MRTRWILASLFLGCSAAPNDVVVAPDTDSGAPRDAGFVDIPARPIDIPAPPPPPDVGSPQDAPAVFVDAPADVTREEFCRGAGPPVLVGDTVRPSTRCIGQIAETVFRHAICTCTDLGLAGYLHTDSFDSSMGDLTPTQRGGAVGINGAFSLIGATRIGDALTISGATPLRLVGVHTIRGDLSLQGSVEVGGTLEVERNARVRGPITALGTFRVRGDLTTPPGSFPLGVLRVDGSRRSGAVDVQPPCACRDDEIVNIAGVVAHGERNNDNASVNFNRTVFNAVVGSAQVELPCGRFYVDRIAGLGAIELTVNGRTALFVGGDFDLGGFFNVRLGPMGELDVFVAGSILGAGYLRMGRVSRPSRVRFYIAGNRGFTLAGAAGFQGNVYAPRAPVTIAGFNEMRGALFANRITTAGDLDIHYDRSIQRAGENCPETPPPAGGCTGCGTNVCRATQACVAGACGMCRADGDCCAPYVCETRTGQCLPIPP